VSIPPATARRFWLLSIRCRSNRRARRNSAEYRYTASCHRQLRQSLLSPCLEPSEKKTGIILPSKISVIFWLVLIELVLIELVLIELVLI
jgi:hypothetical protein